MGIGLAQARHVIEGLFAPDGGRFLCHSTGTAENVERAVPCAGALILREKAADADPMLRVLADRVPRPAGFDRESLRGWERVFDRIAEFIASALPDAPHPLWSYPHEGGTLGPPVLRDMSADNY